MSDETDIAVAARRVADWISRHPGNTEFTCLLPILDVVAAGQGNDRMERYARAICRAEGMDPDGCLEGSPDWMYREAEARAVIAIADAEAAAWRAEYRQARKALDDLWDQPGRPMESPDEVELAARARMNRAYDLLITGSE